MCFSKVTIPIPDLGHPEVGEVGTTIDRYIIFPINLIAIVNLEIIVMACNSSCQSNLII